MDIRSMVHSEDTPPQRKPSISTPVKPEYRLSPTEAPSVYEIQTPAYDSRREIRPPQPSPLQTQGQHDLHLRNGAAYTAVQSPYQQTPPPSFSGGHVPPTQILNQSPSHGYHTPQHSQRESYPGSGHPNGRSFGHSTPLSQTPTTSTPGSASGYANFQRPSSSHSTTTSISAQQSSNFVGESPQPTHHQLRTSSQAQIGQQFMSQPSTPLGPPLTHARPSLNIHRGSPESYDHRRTHSGSSYGQPQATTPSSSTARSPQNNRVQQSRSSGPDHTSPREREGSESVSPKTRLPSLPRVGSMDTSSDQAHRDYGLATPVKRKVEWETSGSQNAPFQVNRAPSLPTSVGMNGLLNTEPPTKSTQRVFREQMTQSPLRSDSESEAKVSGETPLSLTKPMYQPHLDRNVAPVPLCSISTHNSVRTNTPLHQPPQPSMPPGTTAKPFPQRSDVVNSLTRSETNTFHGSSIGLQSQPTNDMARSPIGANNEARQYIKTECSKDGKSTSSQPARKKPRLEPPASEQIPPAKQKLDAEIPLSSSASTLKPRNKTPCAPRIANFRDVPVYARSVRGRERTEELFLLSQRRAATGQNAPPIRHLPKDSPPHRSAQANGNQSANGHTASANNTPVPVAQAIPADLGPLGFWEKSISGIEPMEELTRIVGDFLYESVVLKTDIGVGPAGGAANLGAVFEIEAKIGQLIDLKTNDRLRLPVLNECVINHASSDLRVKFQSSMTEAQHRAFNEFLNNALVGSQPPKPGHPPPTEPRVPMTYKHTRETDTFYKLSPTGIRQLPPSIASQIDTSKAKVRITTEQKSGNVIAKIIKARIADIEVYSPRTSFDWRVSVSVEMDYQGDMKQLVEPDRRDGKRADRNKDRMSYKHQGYQVDLTQVTPAEATSKTEKEHELEIEVSSAEVRRQGKLAESGQPSDYGKLIRTFVDNVRVLARACPL